MEKKCFFLTPAKNIVKRNELDLFCGEKMQLRHPTLHRMEFTVGRSRLVVGREN